jgi:preprotein translocase subunit SecG
LLYALYTIHVIICLFLIMVVLLQQGKGADLSVFGGGGTQTAFGARGAATLLHKLTVFSFVAFIFTTMGIGVLKSGGTSGSVMSDVPVEAPAEATVESEAPSTDPAAAVEELVDDPAVVGDEIIAPVEEPANDGGGAADDGGDSRPPG